MGYYDQSDFKEQKRFPIPIVCIISAIIGGLIVLLFTPLLFKTGIISSPGGSPILSSPGTTQTSSVKINSNITEAVGTARQSVVGVINLKTSSDPFSFEDVEQGAGSGIIIDRGNGKARVITNYHVIENSKEIKVALPDGERAKSVPAKVLGYDRLTDLALLEIDDKFVKAVSTLGDSSQLQPGEPAIAIGNPLGLGQSVTLGVISSPNRLIDMRDNFTTNVIQTDAAINPGNSGGALLNAAGQVIGINTLKITDKGVEGLGFAIPINDARPIINSLVQYGHVPRPRIGIGTIDLSNLPQSIKDKLNLPRNIEGGIAIKEISPGSPADRGGLEPKDVIIALDEKGIVSNYELRDYIYKHKKPGDKLKLTIYRDGKKRTIIITLDKAPIR